MQDYATAIRDIGAVVDILDLPARGINGNSHNPMMDTNSEEISAMTWDWLISKVPR
jgi:hypothetical protein